MDRDHTTPPATYGAARGVSGLRGSHRSVVAAGLELVRRGRADRVKERQSIGTAYLRESGKRPRIAHRAGDDQ
jgi:hypothetical protein